MRVRSRGVGQVQTPGHSYASFQSGAPATVRNGGKGHSMEGSKG